LVSGLSLHWKDTGMVVGAMLYSVFFRDVF